MWEESGRKREGEKRERAARRRHHVTSAEHSSLLGKAIQSEMRRSARAVSLTASSALLCADGPCWNGKYEAQANAAFVTLSWASFREESLCMASFRLRLFPGLWNVPPAVESELLPGR